MLTTLALALTLTVPPAPARAETQPTRPSDPVPVEAATEPAVPPVTPKLAKTQQKEPTMVRTTVEVAQAANPMQHGSFLWYVGIIVVAGVILALLL